MTSVKTITQGPPKQYHSIGTEGVNPTPQGTEQTGGRQQTEAIAQQPEHAHRSEIQGVLANQNVSPSCPQTN